MKLYINRNYATMSLEIRYHGKKGSEYMYMDSNGNMLIASEGFEIPPIIRLPMRTEIESEVMEKDFEALLSQKNEDKESHIQNLNELLIRVLDK